jgi:hypothetical protein
VPSSTFNSEPRAASRAVAVLLTGLFLYCAALEVVTRSGFSRVSRIQRRIYQDLAAAKSLAPPVSNDPPSILIVGNSLLLDGVDRASLKKELAPNYQVTFLPIENTQFEDWYFGLRRLFAEGSRPSVVVVCLSTRQMMSRATDGEYFAYYLMQGRDLLAVRRESQLDNTMTSAYFFANRSDWLGSRAQIRNWLLQEIMPNLDHLIGFFPGKSPPMPPKDQVVAGVLPHLVALNQLCESNGAHLMALVPPTLSHDDASAAVQDSAAREGIPVLVPLRPSDVTPGEFYDGFHLSPRGAARFTHRLASELLQRLSAN